MVYYDRENMAQTQINSMWGLLLGQFGAQLYDRLSPDRRG